jgi:two-component system sensor histidine kinase QseC
MTRRPSIRRRLLVGLIVAMVLLWGIALAFAHYTVKHEVEEIYDANLSQQARVLATLLAHEVVEEMERVAYLERLIEELGEDSLKRSPLLAELAKQYLANGDRPDYLSLLAMDQERGHPYEPKIAFLVRTPDREVIMRSHNAPEFGRNTLGFGHVRQGDTLWRVFGLRVPGSGVEVLVGEQMALRSEIVAYILLSGLSPIFLSLPLLGLLIWIIVGRGLRPLVRVAGIVRQRNPGSLEPLPAERVPTEIMPMVDSLNHLFERVHRALENERRFTANAAHELRTPLAALKTHAQAMQLVEANPEQARSIGQIIADVDRTTHLLEQLLTLARLDAQHDRTGLEKQSLDLRAIAVEVLSDLYPQAHEKHLRLSLEGEEGPAYVKTGAVALDILVRNLVHNAIRYTPTGGSVTVTLVHIDGALELSVADTGPGISRDQRNLVFRRFQRGETADIHGTGLGLSIVKHIAELHGAEIRLEDGEQGQGLRVSVRFPHRT